MPLPTKIKGFASQAAGRSNRLVKSTMALAASKSRQIFPSGIHGDAIRNWVISLFVNAIRACSAEREQIEVIVWLTAARQTISDNSLSALDKAKRINAFAATGHLARGVLHGVTKAYENYKNTNIPVPIKIAIPITLSAAALVGGGSVGIAGFGTAIGVPILLVLFLGVAGITSILEAFLGNSQAKDYISVIGAMIARDEVLRRTNHAMRQAMSDGIVPPKQSPYEKNEHAIKEMLYGMEPYAFESHVVSFFQEAGLLSWATKKSNDAGVDGFARHPKGLIVIQCKRYAESHTVGRPAIQQFKGVVEENEAYRGYLVTTGRFTEEAIQSAGKNSRLVLVGIAELVDWHIHGLKLA